MAQKIVTIVLGICLIAGLAWYITIKYVQPRNSKLKDTQNSSPTSANPSLTNPKLLYFTSSSAGEIWEVSLRNESRKVFTDADENFKLNRLSNLVSNTLIATSKNSELVKINLLTGEVKEIRKNFPSVDYIVLSPDLNQVLYYRFSNLDENYGFTVYSEALDGTNKKALFNSESLIKMPAFNSTGTMIAYATSSGNQAELKYYNLKTKEDIKILDLANASIDSVSWEDESVIYSKKDINNNKGEIRKYNLSTKADTRIATFDGGIVNYLQSYQEYLGWLVAQYNGTIYTKTTGQLYAQKDDEDKIPLKKGDQVLGWW